MAKSLKLSTCVISGIGVAAGLAVWILIPPPPAANAQLTKDVAECLIKNLREVASDDAAIWILNACQTLEGG
jgi:hypothetical protein